MQDIAFIIDPDYSTMALSVVMAFEVANTIAGALAYELHFVADGGGNVRTASGMMVACEPFTQMPFHTLFVGGATTPQAPTPGVLAYVSEAIKRHRRIAAISTGAFVLAEAGLLDGRCATTHWTHAPLLQQLYPAVNVERDRIFANDGPIWTTAGGAAGLDLSLALIESDLGADVAQAVARELVIYHRRTGSQSQISTLLELAPKSDRIRAALTYARDNLHKPLTVPELAEAAHLSPRASSVGRSRRRQASPRQRRSRRCGSRARARSWSRAATQLTSSPARPASATATTCDARSCGRLGSRRKHFGARSSATALMAGQRHDRMAG